ncbi:MAG: sodium:solute symporter family protein [Desulfobacteraceae bacterium]|nr:sodium:solute symporter family protein [Desulfobacteraceae bacterium]
MDIDLIIILVFLIGNLLIGYLCSKRTFNFGQFAVGDRSFGSIIIFCTLSATFIGGGYTLGNAAKVFTGGMVFACALIGFSLKEILVGTIIAPKMTRYHDCVSIGDIIEKNYGTKAKIITGIFSLLICGGILGAQVGALDIIITQTLNINPVLGIFISLAVLLIYSSLGGMKAVVFTDLLQFIILCIGIPLTFFIGLSYVGGWEKIVSTVPHNYIYFLDSPQAWIFFILLFVTFIFGEILVPPYVQRLLMSKSPKETAKGVIYSGIVSVPFFLMSGAIGLIAYTYNPKINPNEVFPFVVTHMIPIGIRGFVIAALLSIILSSASGFLNAASISFVNDIAKPLFKNSKKINLLLMARLSTLIVGIISIIFASMIQNVLEILIAAYSFWSPIILVPLIAAIFNLNTKNQDFFISATCGIIGTLTWQYIFNNPLGISPLLFGLLCSLISFVLSYRYHRSYIK